jgi:acyl-coenzyme A thioesterase PaaI-like protein
MMNQALRMYNSLSRFPLGKHLFSKLLCWKAPYYSTIHPRFIELRPGYAEIAINNRRAIHNHIQSVHAGAMCNLAELLGGLTLDISIPEHLRWIPSGMQVKYLKIARTDLRGTCEIPEPNKIAVGRLPVAVSVFDNANAEVFSAVIEMHVTEKRNTSNTNIVASPKPGT